jgi:ECF transporter S component (folate family)
MKFLKRLIYAAVLCALSIVLTRLLSLSIGDTVRLNLGNIPIMLSGLWLGPLWTAAVGFAADFLGANLFSSSGWYPLLSLAPTLIGVLAAIFSGRKRRIWNVVNAVVLALLICEVGIKPYALHMLFGSPWKAILLTRLPFSGLQALAEVGITVALSAALTPLIKKGF